MNFRILSALLCLYISMSPPAHSSEESLPEKTVTQVIEALPATTEYKKIFEDLIGIWGPERKQSLRTWIVDSGLAGKSDGLRQVNEVLRTLRRVPDDQRDNFINSFDALFSSPCKTGKDFLSLVDTVISLKPDLRYGLMTWLKTTGAITLCPSVIKTCELIRVINAMGKVHRATYLKWVREVNLVPTLGSLKNLQDTLNFLQLNQARYNEEVCSWTKDKPQFLCLCTSFTNLQMLFRAIGSSCINNRHLRELNLLARFKWDNVGQLAKAFTYMQQINCFRAIRYNSHEELKDRQAVYALCQNMDELMTLWVAIKGDIITNDDASEVFLYCSPASVVPRCKTISDFLRAYTCAKKLSSAESSRLSVGQWRLLISGFESINEFCDLATMTFQGDENHQRLVRSIIPDGYFSYKLHWFAVSTIPVSRRIQFFKELEGQSNATKTQLITFIEKLNSYGASLYEETLGLLKGVSSNDPVDCLRTLNLAYDKKVFGDVSSDQSQVWSEVSRTAPEVIKFILKYTTIEVREIESQLSKFVKNYDTLTIEERNLLRETIAVIPVTVCSLIPEPLIHLADFTAYIAGLPGDRLEVLRLVRDARALGCQSMAALQLLVTALQKQLVGYSTEERTKILGWVQQKGARHDVLTVAQKLTNTLTDATPQLRAFLLNKLKGAFSEGYIKRNYLKEIIETENNLTPVVLSDLLIMLQDYEVDDTSKLINILKQFSDNTLQANAANNWIQSRAYLSKKPRISDFNKLLMFIVGDSKQIDRGNGPEITFPCLTLFESWVTRHALTGLCENWDKLAEALNCFDHQAYGNAEKRPLVDDLTAWEIETGIVGLFKDIHSLVRFGMEHLSTLASSKQMVETFKRVGCWHTFTSLQDLKHAMEGPLVKQMVPEADLKLLVDECGLTKKFREVSALTALFANKEYKQYDAIKTFLAWIKTSEMSSFCHTTTDVATLFKKAKYQRWDQVIVQLKAWGLWKHVQNFADIINFTDKIDQKDTQKWASFNAFLVQFGLQTSGESIQDIFDGYSGFTDLDLYKAEIVISWLREVGILYLPGPLKELFIGINQLNTYEMSYLKDVEALSKARGIWKFVNRAHFFEYIKGVKVEDLISDVGIVQVLSKGGVRQTSIDAILKHVRKQPFSIWPAIRRVFPVLEASGLLDLGDKYKHFLTLFEPTSVRGAQLKSIITESISQGVWQHDRAMEHIDLWLKYMGVKAEHRKEVVAWLQRTDVNSKLKTANLLAAFLDLYQCEQESARSNCKCII